MKTAYLFISTLTVLSVSVASAEGTAVSELLDVYKQQGQITPDRQAGQQLWFKKFPGKGEFSERSCTTCHGVDLKQMGKHTRTKKQIKPMAPSANPERLTSTREIKKWFKRNCKWTLGRECTATEKANLLAYINQQ